MRPRSPSPVQPFIRCDEIRAYDTTNATQAAAITLNSTGINAAKNFGVLKMITDANGLTLDASKLTSIKSFVVNTTAASSNAINNMADGSSVTFETANAGKTETLGGAVGAHTVNVTVGTSSLNAATDFGTISVSPFSTINLNSLQKSTSTNANTVALTNADNSSITVTGNGGLTLTVSAANTTGDSVDFSAATGAITYTTSGKGDVIKGGSGTTIINGGTGFDTITLLSGHTNVDTLKATSTTYSTSSSTIDKVTNFVLAQDTLKGTVGALQAGTELSAVKGIVAASAYASASAFVTAALAATGAAKDVIGWVDSSGNTWVAEWNDNTAGHAHIVELVGVTATSISTSAVSGAIVVA